MQLKNMKMSTLIFFGKTVLRPTLNGEARKRNLAPNVIKGNAAPNCTGNRQVMKFTQTVNIQQLPVSQYQCQGHVFSGLFCQLIRCFKIVCDIYNGREVFTHIPFRMSPALCPMPPGLGSRPPLILIIMSIIKRDGWMGTWLDGREFFHLPVWFLTSSFA